MVTAFNLPGKADLVRIGKEERLNVFRRFFASSRYGRLIIQRYLVLSAAGEVPLAQITEMEKAHNQNFSDTFAAVREYGFLDEFLSAVKEEDAALQKIIEAYDRRMEGRI